MKRTWQRLANARSMLSIGAYWLWGIAVAWLISSPTAHALGDWFARFGGAGPLFEGGALRLFDALESATGRYPNWTRDTFALMVLATPLGLLPLAWMFTCFTHPRARVDAQLGRSLLRFVGLWLIFGVAGALLAAGGLVSLLLCELVWPNPVSEQMFDCVAASLLLPWLAPLLVFQPLIDVARAIVVNQEKSAVGAFARALSLLRREGPALVGSWAGLMSVGWMSALAAAWMSSRVTSPLRELFLEAAGLIAALARALWVARAVQIAANANGPSQASEVGLEHPVAYN